MALQKSYEDKHGTTHASSYTKIAVVEMYTTEKVANVQLHLFKDSAARAAGKAPIEILHYRFEGTGYDDVFSATAMDPVDTNPIKLAYGVIKAKDEWTGSTDV